MTDSEYKSLAEFKRLPLYDDDSPSCGIVDDPRDDRSGTRWVAVHEVIDVETAREDLRLANLVPKGAIRFWDGERRKSDIFAYFWEKR
jgi:hypothetical protein